MHQKRNERVADSNPQETAEWVESLEQVLDQAGPDRAAFLLEHLNERARDSGAEVPVHFNTPYTNTIRPEEEVPYPGDRAMERRIKSLIRWNAMAMVVRQNKYDAGHCAAGLAGSPRILGAARARCCGAIACGWGWRIRWRDTDLRPSQASSRTTDRKSTRLN